MGVMVSKRKRAVVAVQAVTKFSQPLRSVNESVCETTEVTDLDKRNGMPEEREDSSMSPLKEDQTPGNSRKSTQSTLISSDSNANFIHRLSVQSNAGMSCKGPESRKVSQNLNWNIFRKQSDVESSRLALPRRPSKLKKSSFALALIGAGRFPELAEDDGLPPLEYLSYNTTTVPTRDNVCCKCDQGHYTGSSKLNGCRVCNRIYHSYCLNARGYCRNGLSGAALKESSTDIGWSCPECENLLGLLKEDEKRMVVETFSKLSGEVEINSSFTKEVFMNHRKLAYKDYTGIRMPDYVQGMELELFSYMDKKNLNDVDWWEYAPPMCIRMLAGRQPFELLELLKPREIERIRVFFRKYDSENTGRLPESLAFKAFDEWYLSLIKHTPDGPKSENWLQDGFMKRKISSSLLEQNSKLPKTISWTQFLKQHALHLISSRPNTVTQRPYVPLYTIDRDMDKLAEDPSSS